MSWATAALTGGSLLAGALSNRSKKTTSTSTTTRNYSPVQQVIENMLGTTLNARLQDPTAGMEPIRTAARNNINAGYSGLTGAWREKALAGGQTNSGRFNNALLQSELGRMGKLTDYEADFSKLLLDREDDTLSLALQMLTNPESTTTTGTSTMPGNMLGGAASSGLQTASLLYSLNKLMKGGGTWV